MICTRGRPTSLAACVASLARQTRRAHELVVVDASSPPLPAAFRRRVRTRLRPTPVRWLASAPGLPRQRNLGVEHATGSVVVFLDDDVVLEPGYLDAIARVYEADPTGAVGGVGGAQVPDPTPVETPWRRAACRLLLLDSHGEGRVKRSGRPSYLLSPTSVRTVDFLSGCNMSFRRDVLADLEFDERLEGYAHGEDLDFSYRVSRRRTLVLTPEARLDHRHVGGGRPDPDRMQAMAVLNGFLFFRDRVARTPLDWLAYAWSSVGNVVLRVREPRARGLRGTLVGWGHVARHVLFGTLPAPPKAPPPVRPRPLAPAVSVVVPARDEERTLGACLASILAQDAPGRLEVIVVENGSRDGTRAVADAFARDDRRVRVIGSEARNQAEAMNDGIMAARGDVVARVDAHSRIAPDYLRRVVSALQRHRGAAGVGGPFLPAGETAIERAVGAARSSPFGVGGGYGTDRDAGDHPVRSVQCGAYWRDALLDVGLFDPAMLFGEDEELNWRLTCRGTPVVLCPDLRQPYRPRGRFRALLRQYWNYGHGRARVLRKHPDFLRPRHLAPSLLVVGVAVLGVAALVSSAAATALWALAALYGVVLIAAGAYALGRVSPREAALVPLAVACMHAGYGAGMLAAAFESGPPRWNLGADAGDVALAGERRA